MKTYRAGIVGCGNVFPMHAITVNQLENVELVAVCDVKKDRAKKEAKNFNCKYYTDYKEMIDKEDLDVVHICTPHYTHAPISIYASNANKHVMTEKPISITMEEAEAMIKASKKNQVLLGVIFQNRYNVGSKLIKETLDSGDLGKIISGKLQVTWKRTDEYYSKSDWKGTWDKEGGGVVIDQAIHTMDLMKWFVGSEIEYIDANIANRTHGTIEVEDMAEGIIKYKNGVITTFYTMNYYSYDAPVEIELHCEKGIVKMIGDKAVIEFNDGKKIIADNNPNEVFDYGNGVKSYWGTSHVKQIEEFYQSVAKGKQAAICGEEATKTQEMICAIYESGKKRKRVYI